MIGRTIGHYRIVTHLGRGGSGTVYQAVDVTLGRDVAVKILNPDLANTEAMKRFCGEATILARLNHPAIATIYELYQSEADLLMVMELVRGETLDALSDRLGPLAPERAAYLVEGILAALEHAHRAGVVHRDMKSANVMVTETGAVKLMDFGIARIHGADRITGDGCMIGTPAYMAPEQVLNQEVDARTDLYAVGVILYHLLTASLPFEAHNPVAVLQRQLNDTPTPLAYHREGLPDWCDAIVQRALAKSPADRFQTAEEFRETLVRAAGIPTSAELSKAFSAVGESGDPGTSAPRHPTLPLVVPIGDAVAAGPASASDDGKRAPTRRSHKATVLAAAALFVVAAALLASRTLLRTPLPPAVAAQPARPSGLPPARPDTGPMPVPATGTAVETPAGAPATIPPANAAIGPPVDTGSDRSSNAPAVRKAANGTPAPNSSTGPAAKSQAEPATEPAKPAEAVTTEREASAPGSTTKSFETMTFPLKALVITDGKPQALDVRLVLGDGTVTVVPNGGTKPLHAVGYENVTSINYSHSSDPLWRSPAGPARVARARGGLVGALRLAGAHDWISLATTTPGRFVILRIDDGQFRPVLSALEQRTGLTTQRIADIDPTFKDRPAPPPKKK